MIIRSSIAILFMICSWKAASAQTSSANLEKIIATQQATIASLQATLEKVKHSASEAAAAAKKAQTTADQAVAAAQTASIAASDAKTSATTIVSSLTNLNEFHTSGEFRFYSHVPQGGAGGFMWVFEKDGNFIRYKCSNFGDYRTCGDAKQF